ncbi:26357_t:CDS:1 [Gigaspora margarita]|uniref:26357_t:CDS:1 n=1 Tax=Gigaspora margarita TaxID=4874 RepID=A0ABN7VIQ7_GIGMA|nr:26357_t:CDS:1 [Gigaspora margarita]
MGTLHKVFEHYKKLTNASSANGMSMVGNCYYDKKDFNRLYTHEFCSQKDASKEEIMAVDLDMNSIEDKCSETKDFKGLNNNHYQSLNISIQTNSAELVLKDKIENNLVSRN